MKAATSRYLNRIASLGTDHWIVPFQPPYPLAAPVGGFLKTRMVDPLRANAALDYSIRWFIGGVVSFTFVSIIHGTVARPNWDAIAAALRIADPMLLIPIIALLALLAINAILVRSIPSRHDYRLLDGLFRYRVSDRLYACFARSLLIKERASSMSFIDVRLSLALAINAFANPKAVFDAEKARLPLVPQLLECISEERFKPRVIEEFCGRAPSVYRALLSFTLTGFGTVLFAYSLLIAAGYVTKAGSL